MDLIAKLMKPRTDGDLIVGLAANQLTAMLFKSGKFVEQLVIPESSPANCLAPMKEMLENHGCSKPAVSLVLSEERYQQTQIDKPTVPASEVAAALVWSVKDLINIPADNIQLDYYDMPKVGGSDRVTVVAAEKKWLKEWVSFFEVDLKGSVNGIQIEELSILNLLNDEAVPVLMLWQKPEQELQILVVFQKKLYLSRGLRGTAGLSRLAAEMMVDLVDNVSLEIQRAIDYFESNLRQPPVRKVMLAIGGANQHIVRERIGSNLGVDVQFFSHAGAIEMQAPTASNLLPLIGILFDQGDVKEEGQK
ncbi:pilus assembly protein PilM [Echinimonas agarilytica]|uniref:Pilus assembly protein PilM n=1 Tax=Echinimonas agarilytica TaxID=1215918 RepID=A0AA41W4F5_9GAMM|nr:pilus assembly protein PilM [Echinimonas agarilytica]MCM2678576.1 pilus assembly protein PilM [Echinimonas agarilytica]